MRWSWWICPWDSQVSIDDASVMGVDCSAIPKNVNIIWWYGEEGEVLYKDRLAIREPFTDFRPLVRYFDAFIRQAQRAKQPITLSQAKFVKSRIVESLDMTPDLEHRHKQKLAALSTVDEVADYEVT